MSIYISLYLNIDETFKAGKNQGQVHIVLDAETRRINLCHKELTFHIAREPVEEG